MDEPPESRENAEPRGISISKQMLKTRSGEFDVESIHTLTLRNMDLTNLGSIGVCTYLEKLYLSGNDLDNIQPLTPLKQLSYLNISANRITDIGALGELPNLQKLNASGNLIGSVDSLRCLSTLDSFTSLILRDRDLTNPLCNSAAYRSGVLGTVPKLEVLDREVLRGNGGGLFELCHELDAMLEGSKDNSSSKNGQVAKPEPWLDKDFWGLKETAEADKKIWESEIQFQGILKSCQELALDGSGILTDDSNKQPL